MTMFRLAISNILSKPWSTALSLVLISFGVVIISILISINHQLETNIEKNASGIDLVVGAKGSPMQLILSSIYHIDYPTGNIPKEEADKLSKHPGIGLAVPLGLGDNYNNYRIVGTDHRYLQLYPAELSDGKLWEKTNEVTIGWRVANELGLKIGDLFHGAHGIEGGGHAHDHQDYSVTGILKQTGTVVDQLILTSMESVWEAHATSENVEASQEITALLIKVKRPMDRLNLPSYINKNTSLQAASPAFEITRLFGLIRSAYDLVRYLAIAIIFISGLSIFVSLYNALKQRSYDISLIRTMGGTRWQVFMLVITEGLIIALLGYFSGIVLAKTGMLLVTDLLKGDYNYSFEAFIFYREELWMFVASLGIGFAAALIPALMAYKTDIATILTEN